MREAATIRNPYTDMNEVDNTGPMTSNTNKDFMQHFLR